MPKKSEVRDVVWLLVWKASACVRRSRLVMASLVPRPLSFFCAGVRKERVW